jgi:hypothetical protein
MSMSRRRSQVSTAAVLEVREKGGKEKGGKEK